MEGFHVFLFGTGFLPSLSHWVGGFPAAKNLNDFFLSGYSCQDHSIKMAVTTKNWRIFCKTLGINVHYARWIEMGDHPKVE